MNAYDSYDSYDSYDHTWSTSLTTTTFPGEGAARMGGKPGRAGNLGGGIPAALEPHGGGRDQP